ASGGGAAAPAPSGSSNATNSGNTGNTSGNTNNNTSNPNAGTSNSTSANGNADPNGAMVFNLFVQGTDTALTLYVSRLPRELTVQRGQQNDTENQPLFSDLRRITWWLAGGTDAPLGLARQEIKIATSDDALGARPPDISDEAAHVYVEEVK